MTLLRDNRVARRQAGDSAAQLATAGGELLLSIRRRLEAGDPPDVVRREGDLCSHELIAAQLRSRYPRDTVLSEEGSDARGLDAARVWIVDPLDGTREFGEPGRCDWAVHVALVEDGELVAGAVALPALGATYSTAAAPALKPSASRSPRIAVSRTRPPEEAAPLAQRLGAELVPMGSAGAKAMAVVTGVVDVYVHSGGQHVWDSAAPAAVASAAGLHVSRIDGSPFACDSTWIPDLLVCRPEFTARVLDALAGLTPG